MFCTRSRPPFTPRKTTLHTHTTSQGIIQHLKREVATVRNRADIDLEEIELENQALRKTCQLRREKIDKQRTEIQKLQATLRDYQKVDSDQVGGALFSVEAHS